MSANATAGRKGAKRSPWSKGPHVDTRAAALSYLRYKKRGEAKSGKGKAIVIAVTSACLLLTACGQPACDPHPGWRPDGQQCD